MPDLTLFPKTTMGAVGDKPQRLTITGFVDDKLFITNMDGGVRPNFQLMYAIGPGIFLNVFQQRMSLFTLEGLYIVATCGDADTEEEPAFFRFYKEHNIVATEEMLTLAFSKITMTGYLIDLKIKNYNQDNVEGFVWVLQFLGWINNLTSAQAAGDLGFLVNTGLAGISSQETPGGQTGSTVAQNIATAATTFRVGNTNYAAVTSAGMAARNPNVDTSFSVDSSRLSPAFESSRLRF